MTHRTAQTILRSDLWPGVRSAIHGRVVVVVEAHQRDEVLSEEMSNQQWRI